MTASRAEPGAGRFSPLRQGRWFGFLLVVVLAGICAMPYVPGLDTLRLSWFDVCQRAAPRARLSGPAVIVDVDGRSLAAHGQWPWPRTLLATLFDRIAAGKPAAVGLDVVMPDPDRLSPQRLPALIRTIGPELAAQLAALPSNDAVLAAAIRGRPIVLALAGVDHLAEPGGRSPGRIAPVVSVGGDPTTRLRRYDTMLRTASDIDHAAAGYGLLNADPKGGAVREIPLLALVGDVMTPSLALEMFRVAAGVPDITVSMADGRIQGVAVGAFGIPTQPDGSVWLRYTGSTPARFVSAADVLAGKVASDLFERKLVLVGVTALGLSDSRTIAGGAALHGVEIHAELIESIFDRALLSRPHWAPWAEAGFLLGAGVLLVLALSVRRPRVSFPLLLVLVALALGGSLALFHWRFLLLDAAVPSIGLGIVFTTMMSLTLAETERQRSALRRQVEQQRLVAARVEGELSAARRIQMGILPKPADVLKDEKRFGLSIVLQPAREVGGDLYDFFKLDADRLFFMLGDVTGKGLAGSLFMVVSKSLYKSTALRRGDSVAKMMREANAEISRDNSEDLFVTVFAGVLDAQTGALEYCNAGHDRPYVLAAGRGPLTQLGAASGPPLCVIDDYAYASARTRLRRNDCLVLFTDGVTDARNTKGEMFGRERLEALLARIPSDVGPESITNTIRDAVTRFSAGTEPADDLAIFILRWDGPPTPE
jgi:serine phosphatase RsbU (regulator of sigma subunit)/CHASE2 domain-containing sensor protein